MKPKHLLAMAIGCWVLASRPAFAQSPAFVERMGLSATEVARQRTLASDSAKELISSDKLEINSCIALYELSMLIGEPGLSIPVLERLLKENPQGQMPGMNLTVSVGIGYMLGTAARYGGNWQRALKAYQEALDALKSKNPADKNELGLSAMTMMYVAEIQLAQGNRDHAIGTLKEIEKLSGEKKAGAVPLDHYQQWAKVNLEILQTGKSEQAMKNRTSEPMGMLAQFQMDLVGLAANNLRDDKGVVLVSLAEKISRSSVSKIDRDLARWSLARIARARKEPEKAYALCQADLQEPGFLNINEKWTAHTAVPFGFQG